MLFRWGGMPVSSGCVVHRRSIDQCLQRYPVFCLCDASEINHWFVHNFWNFHLKMFQQWQPHQFCLGYENCVWGLHYMLGIPWYWHWWALVSRCPWFQHRCICWLLGLNHVPALGYNWFWKKKVEWDWMAKALCSACFWHFFYAFPSSLYLLRQSSIAWPALLQKSHLCFIMQDSFVRSDLSKSLQYKSDRSWLSLGLRLDKLLLPFNSCNRNVWFSLSTEVLCVFFYSRACFADLIWLILQKSLQAVRFKKWWVLRESWEMWWKRRKQSGRSEWTWSTWQLYVCQFSLATPSALLARAVEAVDVISVLLLVAVILSMGNCICLAC